MLKNLNGVLFLIIVITLLSACGGEAKGGKVEVGMNEISVEELENKLDDKDTFYFVGISADEDKVEGVELVDAFDEIAKKDDKAVFYTNFDDTEDDKVEKLQSEYESVDFVGEYWNPRTDGMTLMEEGKAQITTNRNINVSTQRIEELYENDVKYNDEDKLSDIKTAFGKLSEYNKENNVQLTFDD